MRIVAKFLNAIRESFTALPPAPCCAAAIRWVGIR